MVPSMQTCGLVPREIKNKKTFRPVAMIWRHPEIENILKEKHWNVYFSLSATHPSIIRRRTLGCINHCSSQTLLTVLCSEQKKIYGSEDTSSSRFETNKYFFLLLVIPRANGIFKISQIYLSYVVEKAICHEIKRIPNQKIVSCVQFCLLKYYNHYWIKKNRGAYNLSIHID